MENAEYELQLYNITIARLELERRYMLQVLLNNAFENMIKRSAKSEKTTNLLLEQKTKIIQKILNSMEKDFKEHETLDRKYLSIPGHVLLEEDYIFSQHYNEGTDVELNKKILKLKQTYLENSIMAASLEMEDGRFNTIKPYFDEQLETHEQFKQCFNPSDFVMMSTLISETKSIIDKLGAKN